MNCFIRFSNICVQRVLKHMHTHKFSILNPPAGLECAMWTAVVAYLVEWWWLNLKEGGAAISLVVIDGYHIPISEFWTLSTQQILSSCIYYQTPVGSVSYPLCSMDHMVLTDSHIGCCCWSIILFLLWFQCPEVAKSSNKGKNFIPLYKNICHLHCSVSSIGTIVATSTGAHHNGLVTVWGWSISMENDNLFVCQSFFKWICCSHWYILYGNQKMCVFLLLHRNSYEQFL